MFNVQIRTGEAKGGRKKEGGEVDKSGDEGDSEIVLVAYLFSLAKSSDIC